MNSDDQKSYENTKISLEKLGMKYSNARLAGTVLATFTVLLILIPSLSGNFSVQQKSVAALLSGMFGVTSIEAFRRSF